MDSAIARGGLAAGADVLLSRYAGTVTIRGAARVPPTGPLVVVANHAGTVDAPALWRLLAVRDDLRIIALDRPFLHALPHLASRLLFVEGGAPRRSGLVRRVAEHLRSGGAVLTFPAGSIEPDPALRLGDAQDSVATWGQSVELFLRLAPGAAVLPVAVSGVISQRMLLNPLARWRRTAPDRELAAATLQVLVRDRSINPVLAAGEPLRGTPGAARLRSAMEALLQECVAASPATGRR
jgi:putative hemolysin